MAKHYSYSDLLNLFNNDLHRIREFEEIPKDLISLKPDPSTWSAAETLTHIIKFNKMYMAQMKDAMEKNEPVKTEEAQFQPRFLFRQAIRFFEPPYKVKLKTIAPMYPSNKNEEDARKSIERLADINSDLIREIESFKNDQLDLDKIRGKNPLISWVSMSLSEFLLLLEAHQRRHFWQVEQTLLKLSGKKY